MSTHALSIIDTLRDHRHKLLVEEQHEASLVKPANYTIEPPFPIEGIDCKCGGTFDEDDACSDCAIGHDDHDLNSCFACYERAVGQAEAAFEGER